MSFPLPTSLTPSKVAAFTDCALAFRLSTIDRLPEPPSAPAVKGSLVHRALQLLMWEHEPSERSLAAGLTCLAQAIGELDDEPEYAALALDADTRASFLTDAETLVRRYFELEDPSTVQAIGVELRLEVAVGALTLRGIIDRLELDPDGGLVVTDYKTGRAPSEMHERSRLDGVQFYAFLCEQVLGQRPSKIQLLYLADPVAIIATPSDQSIRTLQRRTQAIWTAIERSCREEDFRPRPSRLCDWCAFKANCPAFGGQLPVAGARDVPSADVAETTEADAAAPDGPALAVAGTATAG